MGKQPLKKKSKSWGMGQVVTEEKKYKSFQKMYHSPRLGELKIKVRNNSRNWGGSTINYVVK